MLGRPDLSVVSNQLYFWLWREVSLDSSYDYIQYFIMSPDYTISGHLILLSLSFLICM